MFSNRFVALRVNTYTKAALCVYDYYFILDNAPLRDTGTGSDISCFFLFPSVSPTGAEKPFCPSAQLTLTFSSHLAAAGKHCCSSHLSFHARGLADGYDSSSGNKHKGHSFFQKGCRRGLTTVPSRPALWETGNSLPAPQRYSGDLYRASSRGRCLYPMTVWTVEPLPNFRFYPSNILKQEPVPMSPHSNLCEN